MIVIREHFLSEAAYRALDPAVKRSNVTWPEIMQIMRGYGWAVWNCGNLCWVFTMVNARDEIEVLLAGGTRARECVAPWLQTMLEEPAHYSKTIRVDGRKGWSKLLKNFERRDDVLYLKVLNGQTQNPD